jgi:hypothetical protein
MESSGSVLLELAEEDKLRAISVDAAPDPAEVVENRNLVEEASAQMATADRTGFVLVGLTRALRRLHERSALGAAPFTHG